MISRRTFFAVAGTALVAGASGLLRAEALRAPGGHVQLVGWRKGVRCVVCSLAMHQDDPYLDPKWLGMRTYEFEFSRLDREIVAYGVEVVTASGTVLLRRDMPSLTIYPQDTLSLKIERKTDITVS